MLAHIIENLVNDPVNGTADRMLVEDNLLRINTRFSLKQGGAQDREVMFDELDFLAADAGSALLSSSALAVGFGASACSAVSSAFCAWSRAARDTRPRSNRSFVRSKSSFAV
jgi:hypothetical protein